MKISNRRLESVGRFLTLLLRHLPQKANLDMNKQGWVLVDQLLSNTRNNPRPLSLGELEAVVAFDDKKRFALRVSEGGLEIRCSQGHSADLGLDLGYESVTPPAVLYHGYPESNEAVLMAEGLKGMLRQHVHLTTCKTTAMKSGKRYGKPKIMVIDAISADRAGYRFYCSDNSVWLADYVPPEFMTPSEISSL